MNYLARYLIAVATSLSAASIIFLTGITIGKYAVQHGVPSGFAIATTLGIVGGVVAPAFIVKKLLVDYW
jgi:hypothetical protein